MRVEDGYGIFDVNIIGKSTNQTYMGTFKVKCLLSPMEQIKADKLYRDLLGTNAHLASNHVASLTYAASQLHLRVVEAPPFWEGSDIGGAHIKDENVILEVLENALESQVMFVEEKQEELKKRQEIMANLIRNKKITPEDDPDSEPVSSIKSKAEEQEEEVDLGGEVLPDDA